MGDSGSLSTRWPAARCRQTRFSNDGYGLVVDVDSDVVLVAAAPRARPRRRRTPCAACRRVLGGGQQRARGARVERPTNSARGARAHRAHRRGSSGRRPAAAPSARPAGPRPAAVPTISGSNATTRSKLPRIDVLELPQPPLEVVVPAAAVPRGMRLGEEAEREPRGSPASRPAGTTSGRNTTTTCGRNSSSAARSAHRVASCPELAEARDDVAAPCSAQASKNVACPTKASRSGPGYVVD